MTAILVIDDHEDICDLIEATLKGLYIVKCVASGEEGLRLMQAVRPDLVIIDSILSSDPSRLSGLEVCSIMKSSPALRDIPIIALSGKATIDDVAEFLALGANTFIAKPFHRRVLLNQIAKLLGK